MSLIQCCECNEMVSEYANVCPKCGCPIEVIKRNMKIFDNSGVEEEVISLSNYLLEFKTSPDTYGNNLQTIYEDVKGKIDIIKSIILNEDDNVKQEINNKIAKIIIEGVVDCIDYCNADTCKVYCKMIDFQILSEDTMRFIVNKIYNNIIHDVCKCNIVISNQNHKILWYPINQILLFAAKETKEPLMVHLNITNPYSGGSKYEEIQTLNAESTGTIFVQNIPKCPTCGSTKIKKVSATSKAVSVGLFGLFSQKVKKTWHCNSCGYEW